MIDAVIQVAMSIVLIAGSATIAVSLYRMHINPDAPNLMDLITATDRTGRVRVDSRKCFEAAAFLTSTWVMVFITAAGKFSFEAFGLYMATYTAARFLRDREKRMAAP